MVQFRDPGLLAGLLCLLLLHSQKMYFAMVGYRSLTMTFGLYSEG